MSVLPRHRPAASDASGPPYVSTKNLRFTTKEGPVFGPVDLAFDRARVAVVHGPAGSGRSTLLLALVGRLAGWTGTTTVAGLDAVRDQRALRRQTSIARLAELVDLEDRLRVGETITERALADGVRPGRAELAVANAERRIGHTLPRDRRIDDLGPLERTLLAVALATLRPSRLIVLDDAERGLDLAGQERLYALLPDTVPPGSMCVLSTLEERSIPSDVQVHHLAGGSR